jgi:hypothetical protein
MATTLTATVTVNAAFLQEIKQDNRELRHLLHQVNSAVSRPLPTMRPKQLVGLLQRLRDQLAMHFALEEAYGYFDDAVSVAPRLCYQAHQLRSQHKALFLDICQIVERAEMLLYHETPGRMLGGVIKDCQIWYDAFEEHEKREINLVLAAFQDDLGVHD